MFVNRLPAKQDRLIAANYGATWQQSKKIRRFQTIAPRTEYPDLSEPDRNATFCDAIGPAIAGESQPARVTKAGFRDRRKRDSLLPALPML
jgi:hypothetical protein